MQINVIVLLIITFVNVAVGAFLYKLAQSRGIRPGSFMVVQAFSFLIVICLAIFIRGKDIEYNPYYCYGIMAGTVGITGALSSLMSLRKGELGINMAIVRMSFIPTVFGAVFLLNEVFTLKKGLILIIGILSIILFLGHYRKHNPVALTSLFPALTACLAFGIFDFLYKFASNNNIDPFIFLFVQSLTGNIIINCYVFFYEKYEINKIILVIAPICGILFATSCLSYIHALAYIDISLISPVVQMNFILSYILGVIFFKEIITLRKIFGIICVILAILILSGVLF